MGMMGAPLVQDDEPSGWDMFSNAAMLMGPALMGAGFNMPALGMMGPQLLAMQQRGQERRQKRQADERWNALLNDPEGAFSTLSEAQRVAAAQLGPEKGATLVGGWVKPAEPKATELSPGKAWGKLVDLSTKDPNTWTAQDKATWTGAYGVVNQPKMSLQPDPATGMMMPIYTQPQIPFAARPWEEGAAAPAPQAVSGAPAPAAAPQPAPQPVAAPQTARLTPDQAKEARKVQATYDTAMTELQGYEDFLKRLQAADEGYVLRGADYAEAQQWKAALLRVLGDMQAAGTIQDGEAKRLMRSLVDISEIGVGNLLRYGTDPLPEARRALDVLRGRLNSSYAAKMQTYTTPGTPAYQPPAAPVGGAVAAEPKSGTTKTGIGWSID